MEPHPEQRDELAEQVAYYRARAGEYDDWFFRRGRYDRGPALNREWFAETAELERRLDEFAPRGHVLELACGTGLFTRCLLHHAAAITAVDAAPEVIALNRERTQDSRVTYVEADIFSWRPTAQFDVVFFSFWLSHVPPERFVAFWELVRASLAPGGRVCFIDSLYAPESTAADHVLPDRSHQAEDEIKVTRRLSDGREFEIFKIYYAPELLERDLAALGWRASVGTTGRLFLYGSCALNPQWPLREEP